MPMHPFLNDSNFPEICLNWKQEKFHFLCGNWIGKGSKVKEDKRIKQDKALSESQKEQIYGMGRLSMRKYSSLILVIKLSDDSCSWQSLV